MNLLSFFHWIAKTHFLLQKFENSKSQKSVLLKIIKKSDLDSVLPPNLTISHNLILNRTFERSKSSFYNILHVVRSHPIFTPQSSTKFLFCVTIATPSLANRIHVLTCRYIYFPRKRICLRKEHNLKQTFLKYISLILSESVHYSMPSYYIVYHIKRENQREPNNFLLFVENSIKNTIAC